MQPWIIYKRNRKWFGVTYFLITVGTLQAVLTPDLAYGFPHFDFITFFLLHNVLVMLPIYCIIYFGWIINWRDVKNTFIYINIYFVVTLVVNYLIGSNYFYTKHKPS